MKSVSILDALQGWSAEDLANLSALLEKKKKVGADSTPESLAEALRWHYHSRTRTKLSKGATDVARLGIAKVTKTDFKKTSDDDVAEMPSYTEILGSVANKLKVHEADASMENLELYISQAVTISALKKMRPSDRAKFFAGFSPTISLLEESDVLKESHSGPKGATIGIGVLQASGFGIYAASTTALGFATHAIGVTLPFAAYTGLTQTIAFVIGPVGWLAAGSWWFYSLTQPSWRKMTEAVLYIAHVNSRKGNILSAPTE